MFRGGRDHYAVAVLDNVAQFRIGCGGVEWHDAQAERVQCQQVQVDVQAAVESECYAAARRQLAFDIAGDEFRNGFVCLGIGKSDRSVCVPGGWLNVERSKC